MYKEQIDAYIEGKREEMLSDLSALVAIPSVKGDALPGSPYGEEVTRALAAAEKLMADSSMTVTNYENHVVAGDYGPSPKELDILAHLDVVPVSADGWKKTAPFETLIEGNRIYGRGTSDDKGPAIAVIYAIRAIRDLQIPLQKGVRLILGGDEECGSSDLEYYYAKETEAPWSFTPDAEFPLINLEKARLSKNFTASFDDQGALPRVTKIAAGDTPNIVPAKGDAVVLGLAKEEAEAIATAVANKTGTAISLTQEGEELKIHVEGLSAHASTPSQGKNAAVALCSFLAALPLASCQSTHLIKDLARLFPYGDTKGEALGIAMEEEKSGALTLNFGILRLSEGEVLGNFDIRAPLCATDENLTAVLSRTLQGAGFTMEEGKLNPAHYVPEDSSFIKALLEVYETYTGKPGKAMSTGGGTYVHHLERGVAFGCGLEEVDNRMHGDDEFMEISTLLLSAKIFALAILKICGVKES
ncbi:MAG: Sapep family Mn(2+)-dependent dipeptidase [Blautia sp.]|nr:Sapep family Mn(2+)-dependent dipeptidase [Blautia sp.]